MNVRARSQPTLREFRIDLVPEAASANPGSPSRRVRVLAVDDVATFRRAIRTMLRANRRLELVGEAESGECALAATQSCNPDLVLMDVRMPGMGGLAAATAIKAQRPDTVVILISTAHPSELPADASACGADDILWKSQLRPGVLEEMWLRHRPPTIT